MKRTVRPTLASQITACRRLEARGWLRQPEEWPGIWEITRAGLEAIGRKGVDLGGFDEGEA